MASAPLNWLLKIGSTVLKTTEQTLTGAVNELKDSISSLQSQTSSQFSGVAADMSKKVNKTDVLSLEEIYATTNLTDKAAAAEAVKEVNASFGGLDIRYNSVTKKPEWKERGADSFSPFSSGDGTYTITGNASVIHYGGHNTSYFLGRTSISISLSMVDGVLSIDKYSFPIHAEFQDDEGHGAVGHDGTGSVSIKKNS